MSTTYFDFDNVRLLPKKGIAESRDDCDTSVKFGSSRFKLGVTPANMLCSINEELAIKLAENGYFYVYHRFGHDNMEFAKKMNEKGLITSISVGVNEDSYQQIRNLKAANLRLDYITIDVAHGHCNKMERMVKFLKDELQNSSFIIGGNICTPEAVNDLSSWGCDALKAGIGPGAACTTYMSTNVGSRGWQASMIQQLGFSPVPIICDGGIRSVGHICVSFAMGATMTMVGSMLSGFHDSPGDIVIGQDKKQYKEFFGSASEFTKGHKKYVEGKKLLEEAKEGTLIEYLDNTVSHGVKSCISYIGGTDMNAFNNVKYIVV